MIRRVTMCVLLVLLTLSMMSCFGCGKKAVEVAAPPVVQAQETDQRPIEEAQPGPYSSEGYLEKIYFDFDKSTIRPDQMKNAEGNAKWMLDHADMKVLIEGHCDERGTVEYNLGLGSRRANAVRDLLVKRGVNAENISVMSKGKEEPADPGHTEEAWAKNRRDEFKFLSKPPAK